MSSARFPSRPDADRSERVRVLTAVASEAEAELIRLRLLDTGASAIHQRTIGGPQWGASARRIFINDEDVGRAQQVLAPEGGLSEEEIARLSDEAGADSSGR